MTPKEIEEFKACADPKTGYTHFLKNYYKVNHPMKGAVQFDPYYFQTDLLKHYHENRYSYSVMARQMGASVSAVGYILWLGMFNPNQAIMIVSHSLQGATQLMQTLQWAYQHLPEFMKLPMKTYNKSEVEFENGSRIFARAANLGTAGRGMSLSLVYADNFGFYRDAREFMQSILPCVVGCGGKMIVATSGGGSSDFACDMWEDAVFGMNRFKPIQFTWQAHPDRNEGWAEEQTKILGEDRFRAEYECRL